MTDVDVIDNEPVPYALLSKFSRPDLLTDKLRIDFLGLRKAKGLVL